MSDFPSPSEQDFHRRVRDLEALAYDASVHIDRISHDNARLRRALRTLTRLQSPRVSRAVMEVLNDA